MTLDTIRRTLRRAFERLNVDAEIERRPITPRARHRGEAATPEEKALLRRTGFAEEALPWMNAVHRFALSLTRDGDAAQDLVQDTYLRAYRSWHTYERGTSCRSWLFTICRNTFLHGLERRSVRDEVPAAALNADVESAAMRDHFERIGSAAIKTDDFFENTLDERVIGAIDALPESYREVLVLSDLGDLTYPEIEQVLTIPRGTVKSRLFRARRMLQAALLDYGREMGYVARNSDEKEDVDASV